MKKAHIFRDVFLSLCIFLAAASPVFAREWNNKKVAASLSGHSGDFSFLVVGDTRGPNSRFPEVLAAMKKEKNVLFTVHLGDIVNYAVEEEYRTMFFGLVGDYPGPMLIIPGNHERYKDDRADLFRKYFGSPIYFSFILGENQFIFLDNSVDKALDREQLHWLRGVLKEDPSLRNRFVFMHTPMEDPRKRKTPHAMTNTTLIAELREIFDEGKVTMVFTGHIHSHYSGRWGKTPYTITGGGGSPLYGKDPNIAFHHFIRVNLEKGVPRYEVVRGTLTAKGGKK